jgi:hypothetical protein
MQQIFLCPKCGNQANKSHEFCGVCGHKLHDYEAEQKELEKKVYECYLAVKASRERDFFEQVDDDLLWHMYLQVSLELEQVRKLDPSRRLVGGVVDTFKALGLERKRRTGLPNEATEMIDKRII